MFRTRMARILAGSVLVATPILVATPAHAQDDAQYIGKNGHDTRCYDHIYDACLYAGPSIGTTYAYLPAMGSLIDLKDHEFWDNTGINENTVAYNTAGAVFCGNYPDQCDIFREADYKGDYDYLYTYQVGALYHTKNHAGSLKLYY